MTMDLDGSAVYPEPGVEAVLHHAAAGRVRTDGPRRAILTRDGFPDRVVSSEVRRLVRFGYVIDEGDTVRLTEAGRAHLADNPEEI